MYGWRGRIGLLVLSTNSVCEVEFHKAVPDGVSVHTARIMFKDVRDKKEKIASLIQEDIRDVIRASKEVACVKPKVIALACTAMGFAEGTGHDQKLIEEIEAETGITALTTSTAVLNAFEAMNIRRVAVATPYIRELEEKERVFLEESISGLRVTTIQGPEIISAFEKGDLEPRSAYAAAREVDSDEADSVFISCGAWRTLEIIEPLERDIGKPVITSNQVTLWAALKVLGISGLSGYGQLLERF
jgi:maleate isomerase